MAFDEPWQARVFGLAAAVVETRSGGDREAFRCRLIEAVTERPDRPYWESWLAALEALLVAEGVVSAGARDSSPEVGAGGTS